MIDLFGEKLFSLLFPHKCFCCGQVLVGTSYLCAACENGLPLTDGLLCSRCGKMEEECACAECDGGYTRASAPFFYTDGVPHGIHRFKYDGRRYYATFLAAQMAARAREDFAGAMPTLITYVPMHPKKQRQRGFCQSEALAALIAVELQLPMRGDILLHTANKTAQMEQRGLANRQSNADKSYASRKAASLHGERILLVDDVLTTGSTARRCALLLLKKGAGEVFLLVAATTRAKIQIGHI